MATERKHHSKNFEGILQRCRNRDRLSLSVLLTTSLYSVAVTKDDFTSILLSIRDMGLVHQTANLLDGDMEPAEGKSMQKVSR